MANSDTPTVTKATNTKTSDSKNPPDPLTPTRSTMFPGLIVEPEMAALQKSIEVEEIPEGTR